ncbi:MAG: hypothetical protein U0996_16975 [Planctomycetaceae bacterium]
MHMIWHDHKSVEIELLSIAVQDGIADEPGDFRILQQTSAMALIKSMLKDLIEVPAKLSAFSSGNASH